MSGTLYLVPTPIGNLEDITLRALATLKAVDLVVCEDTRQTMKLLQHYQIQKPLVSFFTYNQHRRIPSLINDLRAGKNAALVSDSGTPAISDPGFYLVEAAVKERIPVVALPGPNAAVTALIGSGLPTAQFIFLGFLKRKAGKMKKELRRAAASGATVLFYESPHRIRKTVSLCKEVFGAGTPMALGRELTKKFEEYLRGTIGEIEEQIRDRELPGEFVVVIAPQETSDTAPEDTNDEEEDD